MSFRRGWLRALGATSALMFVVVACGNYDFTIEVIAGPDAAMDSSGGLVDSGGPVSTSDASDASNLSDASDASDATADVVDPCEGLDFKTDPKNCGACGKACDTGDVCTNGFCTADGAIYVSGSKGDDANDGLTPSTAKKTIVAGIAAASLPGPNHHVRVCKGGYVESDLRLERPIGLFGGYDCTTWKRTATYGYPTFDGTNETIVERALGDDAGATARATLTVKGAGVGSGTTIDGFTIQGPIDPSEPSRAIYVAEGVTAVLSNLKLHGGYGTGNSTETNGSIAVHVDANAAPEITHCDIDGGGGSTQYGAWPSDGIGSMGVWITNGGTGRIHDNTIHGGNGRHTTGFSVGSIGVWHRSSASMTGANAISRNTIDAGTGSGPVAAVGVTNVWYGGVGDVELAGNTITVAPCPGKACWALGGLLWAASYVHDNRISNSATRTSTATMNPALEIVFETNGRVVNNEFFAGSDAMAFYTHNNGSLTVAHNTMMGSSIGATQPVQPLMIVQVDTQTANVNVKVDDNLIFTGGTRAPELVTCTKAPATLAVEHKNNAYVSNAPFQVSVKTCDPEGGTGTTTTYTTLDDLEAALVSMGLTASGNVRVSATCPDAGEAGCIARSACTDDASCAKTVLTSWDPATAGGADLLTGWTIRPDAPCKITQGGLDLLSSVPKDITQATRTAPVSIGARELDDNTCTP